jgi:DNA-binding response OmpR family regulator
MVAKLNITVIEDHDALRAVTMEALRQQGHDVQGIDCAEALDDEVAGFHAQIFVIDINLPGEDGLSLARRIRKGNPSAGIIMASGRVHVDDRIAGYDSGADVYLPKPVAVEELLAAVTAIQRRIELAKSPASSGTGEGFTVDSRAMLLNGPKGSVVISRAELQMLSAFATSAGQQLEYWQLMEALGQQPDDLRKATLEVKMVRLRKKLFEVGAEHRCIRSIRLVGYQLCVPLQII